MGVLALAAGIGLAVGAVVGALGGGGGILTVPVLVYLLGLEPHLAATAALVIVGATSLVALLPHARARHVRWRDGTVFGLLGALWAYAGALASVSVDPDLLMAMFAALLTVVAVLMLRRALTARRTAGPPPAGPTDGPPASEPPAGPPPAESAGRREAAPRRGRLRSPAMLLAAASGTGLLTGFFGVGGGFTVIPALVLVLGLGMRDAVGTSLLVVVLNSVTGLAGRLPVLGEVDWGLVAAFALAAMAGGVLGTRISARAPADRLALAFALLLVGVSVATAAQAFPALLR